MHHWILPTLSEILALSSQPQGDADLGVWKSEQETKSEQRNSSIAQRRVRAEREWFGAIAALESLLKQIKPSNPDEDVQGLVLSGPLPVVSQTDLTAKFATWTFTADPSATLMGLPFRLCPAIDQPTSTCETNSTLSLLPGDPLANEQFALVLTDQFGLVMVLGENSHGEPSFSFTFDPEVIDRVWQVLRLRVVLMNAHQMSRLDALMKQFPTIAPHYQLVTQFSHFLLTHLSAADEVKLTHLNEETIEAALQRNRKRAASRNVKAKKLDKHPTPDDLSQRLSEGKSIDVELLQAIAHEVRTPLSTIRTLTRSLLKRRDLAPDVLKRLEMIDRACSEQIDRFGLIFRAVELETSTTSFALASLAPTSLAEVLRESIPRWQKQASQRNLTLEVSLPRQMPTVVSDPTMLDQALTSLIDRSARSLPSGSHIQVEVTLAGNQLKLQLESSESAEAIDSKHHQPLLKSLGQVLMFQPETGSLSLNLNVTKNLFQALGGKLIVRQRPERGEVFTLFLPLEPG
ncbi:MAG: HAMP domain-containing histidine kinase [Phormidesmis sp. CAN_BIN36]|nr:HAMP domain-containing histidine kinase [Phormidesmis sp. CAN_BIN36]